MKNYFLFLLIAMFFLCCQTSMKTTSSWVNRDKSAYAKKQYKTIFIAVITSNLEVRTKLEEELAMAAEKHGYIPIKSLDKFPPLTAGKKPTIENIFDIVKKVGADAIFTTALVRKESERRYVPGTAIYTPWFYGGFRGYYGTAWMYYDPGYYTKTNTYFLESNLFDATNESVIWSAQSEVYNPISIENTSKRYTALMIAQLEKDGVLKPNSKEE